MKRFYRGSSKSLKDAIKNGICFSMKATLPMHEEIEIHVIEFLRNQLSVVSIRSEESFKLVKEIQELIERVDEREAA